MLHFASMLIALIAFIPACYADSFKSVIDIMSSPNICSINTKNQSITANLITPSNISIGDQFFNKEACGYLNYEKISYSPGLVTADISYTIAVSMVTNNSTDTIYLAKSTYLVPSDQSQCNSCTIIVPTDTFLNNYPDFTSIANSFKPSCYGFLGTGISIGCGGLIAFITGATLKATAQQQNARHSIAMLMGGISFFVGAALASSGYGIKVNNIDPAEELAAKYGTLVTSLQPYIIPRLLTVNSDLSTLSQLISNPVTGNIQNNVYKLDPGQTLIEPVIVPVGVADAYSGISLQYYTQDPGFIYQIYTELNIGT